MEDLVEQNREKGYSKTKDAWSEVLPKIKERKEEFRLILHASAKGNAQGDLEQERIETEAADELLEMNPEGLEKMLRDYDKFSLAHRSLLEDKETGFRLEAQRHWVPVLISMVRKIS